MASHVRGHEKNLLDPSADKPFACEHCDYRARKKDHMRSHQLVHSGEALRVRPMRLPHEQQVQPHSAPGETHGGEAAWLRPVHIPHVRQERLEAALEAAHGREAVRLQEVRFPYSRQEQPKDASASAHIKSHLRRHLRSHAERKAFVCERCSFCAISMTSLSKHMAVHTNE